MSSSHSVLAEVRASPSEVAELLSGCRGHYRVFPQTFSCSPPPFWYCSVDMPHQASISQPDTVCLLSASVP